VQVALTQLRYMQRGEVTDADVPDLLLARTLAWGAAVCLRARWL
jgi:hypothetical protein